MKQVQEVGAGSHNGNTRSLAHTNLLSVENFFDRDPLVCGFAPICHPDPEIRKEERQYKGYLYQIT